MVKKLFFIFVFAFSFNFAHAEDCNIYIHGYSGKTVGQFDELDRQVDWDSSNILPETAPLVAEEILKKIETCPNDSTIILRPHSYGAAQVFYILAQGRRFQNLIAEHNFVKIYKKVAYVISYAGAYHGTPIMDMVCNSEFVGLLGGLLGKDCVPTLTTSTQLDASHYVTTPGVPTYLYYSTNHKAFLGVPGVIIGKSGLSFSEYFLKGKVNQNDNTLPQYSTRACASTDPITDPEGNCKKLDSNYFIDLYHETKMGHTAMPHDAEVMTRTLEEFMAAEK